MRRAIARWMRRWVDRLDDAGAPKYMGRTFTFETGEGIRFREDGRGCRLFYVGAADYEKAHTEADSAAEDAARERRLELIRIAMGDPDPVKAGEAAAELQRLMFEGLRA